MRIKSFFTIFIFTSIIIFSLSCRKNNYEPVTNIYGVDKQCSVFNPDSLKIEEDPVWTLKNQQEILLYFPNQEEAEKCLAFIRKYRISEQCQLNEGQYTDSTGHEVYENTTMYYFLSDGKAPILIDEEEDALHFDYTKISSKKMNGGWTVLHKFSAISGEKMYHFDDRETCEDAVKILQHYRFNINCYIGRPHPSVNYFLRSTGDNNKPD